MIVAGEKEEVECDRGGGGVWGADSSMLLTLAGRGKGAVQNINVFPLSGDEKVWTQLTCS